MIGGMTKKIGISLPDELYQWAADEVRAGRATSVSALIADGLRYLESRALLREIIDDLRAELGEPDDETKARGQEAMRAAEEAQRRHIARTAGNAA
jgi:Arc/MetJ-type ribon-helix-helix transcriptional regulator